jgi:oligoendopeptidase F
MDIPATEIELSKEADEYAKQFDSEHREVAAEHYYQGAMAEREKMRALLSKLIRQCRTFPGSDLRFLSEIELVGSFKDNGI